MLWYTASSAKYSTSSVGVAPLPNASQNSQDQIGGVVGHGPERYIPSGPSRPSAMMGPWPGRCSSEAPTVEPRHGGGYLAHIGEEWNCPVVPHGGLVTATDRARDEPPSSTTPNSRCAASPPCSPRRWQAGDVEIDVVGAAPRPLDHAVRGHRPQPRSRRRAQPGRGVRRAARPASSSPTRGRRSCRRRTSARRSAIRRRRSSSEFADRAHELLGPRRRPAGERPSAVGAVRADHVGARRPGTASTSRRCSTTAGSIRSRS